MQRGTVMMNGDKKSKTFHMKKKKHLTELKQRKIPIEESKNKQ